MIRILLFEKDLQKGKNLKRLLEQSGVNVIYTTDTREAFNILSEGKVNFIVIDIEKISEDSDFDLEILDRYHHSSTVSIIFIISNPESDFSPLKYNLNVDDVILKPYREEEVALRVINQLKNIHQIKFKNDELEKLSIINRINNLPYQSLNQEQLSTRILEIIRQTFNPESAAIFLVEADNQVKLLSFLGPVEKSDLWKLKKFTANRTAREKSINFFSSLVSQSFWGKENWKRSEFLNNAISLPLNSGDKTIAVMELYNAPSDLFGEKENPGIKFLKQVSLEAEKVLNLSIEFTRMHRDLQFAIDELSILYEISNALSSTLNLDEMLKLVVRNAAKSFNAQVVSLMLLDKESNTLSIRHAEGLQKEIIEKTRVPVGEGISGKVAQTGEPLLLVDVREIDAMDVEEDIKSALSVPLKMKDEVIGVLNVSKTSRYQFTETDLKLLFNLASLAAQAIEKASLYSDIKNSLDEIKSSYMSTVKALSKAVEAKDPYTQGHVDRVAKYGLAIAMELDTELLKNDMFQYALVLHDIGKIEIPDAILTKESSLTDEEMAIMRRHPETGAQILQPVKFLRKASEMVRFHQERWDGKGYPLGLKGDKIPLAARIISVADAFDAITSDRPYRKARSIEKAADEIKKASGSQFDPRVVEAFLSALNKKMIP